MPTHPFNSFQKLRTALVGLTLSTTTLAQVGIGTNTPNASAALDIDFANKGLLIPRINLTSLTDAGTIPSPAT
ncbi:MAG TPA: hypothetical protein PKD90_19575, partial [Phnomibacter sp.]|nr:hypothetical protein [Phnomibacter sp.]